MLTLTKKSFMARLKPLNQNFISEPRIKLCFLSNKILFYANSSAVDPFHSAFFKNLG